MIYDSPETVRIIKSFIEKKLEEKHIEVIPIREDVFAILSRECKLLYYPLDDDGIKGCHVEKVLDGETTPFVFINTKKSPLEQSWTAAHELGHVWKVDEYVKNEDSHNTYESEDIVNRFASELLLPEELFVDELYRWLKDNNIQIEKDYSMSKKQFMSTIAYLMNAFASPYKAVIKRLVELGYISKENEEPYILAFGNNIDDYKELMQTNYFLRLKDKYEAYSMESVGSDIDELERRNAISERVAKAYREMFHIVKEDTSDETFIIGDKNVPKD